MTPEQAPGSSSETCRMPRKSPGSLNKLHENTGLHFSSWLCAKISGHEICGLEITGQNHTSKLQTVHHKEKLPDQLHCSPVPEQQLHYCLLVTDCHHLPVSGVRVERIQQMISLGKTRIILSR